MNDFYVSLPSASCDSTFPENTVSSYRVQLDGELSFHGDWEVGLCEIHFPVTWYNVQQHKNYFLLNGVIHKLRPGYYDDVNDIIFAVKELYEKSSQKQSVIMHIYHDQLRKRVTIENLPDSKGDIAICQDLARCFGFSSEEVVIRPGQNVSSTYLALPDAAYQRLYVYSDAVEPSIVGDLRASLLRVVPTNAPHGSYKSVHYERPHYLPVGFRQSRTIRIELRLESGDVVPFESGTVLVKLHFRRRRCLHR